MPDIELNLTDTIQQIVAVLADGINLPEVSGVAAEPNSIFYNTDTDLVSWKSHGGTILRFNLSL